MPFKKVLAAALGKKLGQWRHIIGRHAAFPEVFLGPSFFDGARRGGVSTLAQTLKESRFSFWKRKKNLFLEQENQRPHGQFPAVNPVALSSGRHSCSTYVVPTLTKNVPRIDAELPASTKFIIFFEAIPLQLILFLVLTLWWRSHGEPLPWCGLQGSAVSGSSHLKLSGDRTALPGSEYEPHRAERFIALELGHRHGRARLKSRRMWFKIIV